MRFLKLLDVETSLKVYYFPESLKTRAVQVLVVFEKAFNERVIPRIRAYKATENMIS